MGGVYFEIDVVIQDFGTYIRKDVELTLRNSCATFRADVWNQMGRIKGVQQQMAQCMENIVSDVDTRPVQKDQRNNAREGLLVELCATLKNSNAKLDKNIQETQQMDQKYIVTRQRMEGMINEANVEVGGKYRLSGRPL